MDINGSGEKRRLWASVEHQASAENFRQIADSRGWSTCWLQIQGYPTPYYSLMKSAPRHQVERPFCSPTISFTPCMCPPFLESCVTGVVFACMPFLTFQRICYSSTGFWGSSSLCVWPFVFILMQLRWVARGWLLSSVVPGHLRKSCNSKTSELHKWVNVR